MALKLVMMGTGSFALPTFLGLFDTPHEVVALYTQPDRTGRGHHHHVNVMKEAAIERGVPVFQPPRINDAEALAEYRSLGADLTVVAAYGQILSKEVIETPRLGTINLHASLLPKYRGAAPVQYSILCGEAETGVTIFQIEPKLDAGAILGVAKTAIEAKETSGALAARLAELAVPLTKEVVDAIEAGTTEAMVQDASGVTLAPRLKKEDGIIDWSRPACEIDWHVRGMQPWPKAVSWLHRAGKSPLRMIILDVDVLEDDVSGSLSPGELDLTAGRRLVVGTGSGAVEIQRLQPDGKRALTAAEFLAGHPPTEGDRFGSIA